MKELTANKNFLLRNNFISFPFFAPMITQMNRLKIGFEFRFSFGVFPGLLSWFHWIVIK